MPQPPKKVRNRVVYFAFGLAIVTYLDRVCISAAAPYIMQDLNLSVMQMSLVFSAFTLAYSLFEIPSGWMGDVIGPRKVLTRIVAWWSAFTMLTSNAGSYLSLLVIRFLFGAGEAGAFPNISRAYSRWIPLQERGRANGILFLGSRLGGALAPGLALLLIQHWGWREAFVTFGAVGGVWAFWWHRWFRDDPAQHPGVGEQELAFIRQSDGSAAPSVPHSVPWRVIFSSRNLYMICLMYFAFGYGLYFYFTWLPTYLTKVLGFSGLAGGLLAGLPFILAGAANVLGGSLSDRLATDYGLRAARCWLGFVSFSSSALLLFGSTQAKDSLMKAILIALALASADFALSACWAVCLDVGKEYAGVVTGFMNTFGNLGGFLGPLVVGYAVGRLNSWVLPFHVAAVIYALGAICWLAVDPSARIMPNTPTVIIPEPRFEVEAP